jgi:UDP-N-acetylmuramoyl-tripeptide--D-alanyl-D-alanine ligase
MLRLVKRLANALRVSRAKSAKLLRYVTHTGGLRLRAEIWTLSQLGMAKRALNPQVTYVGVTGSAGKTTTAKLIGAVLATAGECRVNIDQNGVHSIARSVLTIGPLTKFSVQEVCGARPGKIRTQTKVLRPQIGVITTVGSDHYRKYRSLEATAKEKGMLAEAVPSDGTVLLNADDPHVRAMAARCRGRVVTYGISPDADIRGTQISSAWPDRLALTVVYGHRSVRVVSRLVGEHWCTSVLAAVACGVVCGLNLKTCAEAIASCEPFVGRYSVHEAIVGPAFVLDHKASRSTIASSLAFIGKARANRKTIVFGTLSDYPGAAGKQYRRVARQALEVADRVVFVGPHSAHMSKLRQGDVRDRLFAFQTTYEAAEFLGRQSLPGELVLLKGSSYTDHLERIILAQIDSVVCWKQGCGRMISCQSCGHYGEPSPPPFGLGQKVKHGDGAQGGRTEGATPPNALVD